MLYRLSGKWKEFTLGDVVEVKVDGVWRRGTIFKLSKFNVHVDVSGMQCDVMMTVTSAPHHLCFNDIRRIA